MVISWHIFRIGLADVQKIFDEYLRNLNKWVIKKFDWRVR